MLNLHTYLPLIFDIACFVLAAFFMSVMDSLQFHGLLKGDPFWDPKLSWTNKYKNYPADKRAKFFGSKTFLVFLTDGWHLMQFFMLTCFTVASIPEGLDWKIWLLWFVGLRIVFGLVFTLFFDKIFNKTTA